MYDLTYKGTVYSLEPGEYPKLDVVGLISLLVALDSVWPRSRFRQGEGRREGGRENNRRGTTSGKVVVVGGEAGRWNTIVRFGEQRVCSLVEASKGKGTRRRRKKKRRRRWRRRLIRR